VIVPGLSTIKTWLLAGLGVVSAILFGLWKASQAQRVVEKLKGIKQARETERKAAKALVDGLQREQEKVDDAKHRAESGRRDHFES